MDASNASSQLVSAESVVEALSEASVTAKAESLDEGHQALKAFTDATKGSVSAPVGGGGHTDGGGTGKANQFQEPIMLFASPNGIGLSTQGSTHVSADAQVNLVSGKNTVLAVGKSLIASVKEKVSLFVQNGGMKLFAAKGAVEIQAQSNNVEIAAQNAVKVVSATAHIDLAAKQEILLTSGGAYIRISGGNIEIHAPGKIDVKGGEHSFSGPAQKMYPLPEWNQADTHGDVKFNMSLADMGGAHGQPYINMRWRIVHAPDADEALMTSETLLSGETDLAGKIVLSDADQKALHLAYNQNPSRTWLVYSGQVRRLVISRESARWTETDKRYEALDAMGYSDQLYISQRSDTDTLYSKLARQELGVNSGDEMLSKLKRTSS